MNKIKNKKIPHSWNILKIKSKMVERGQSTPLTHIHDRSLSWLGTCTTIESGRIH
jgi:hypothetical protein